MKMKVFACLMALLMSASSAFAWEAPYVEAPYDYSYEDETRSIAIRKVFADCDYDFRRVVRRVRHAQKADRLIAARAEHIKSAVLIEQRRKDRQSGIIDLL